MSKCEDGEYHEIRNGAISNLLEPGSVFKTASIMVALDDGVVDTTYTVETGCGIWNMYGRDMKDHNWRRGGYHLLTLPQTLWYSSNIGVSRIIDDHYHNNPEKFVEGLYRIGIANDLHLPLTGAARPRIRFPEKDKKGVYTNWSKTTLPWMSIGYETQVPAISTITFYNAIANNGRMMRPRFVKKIIKGDDVIAEFPPEVIKPHICKDRTLHEIQKILEEVVSIGLGKKAGSKAFKVAGKTGTAQISQGKGGYKSGAINYLLSFAGYFPADNPQYSCIVCIQKTGSPASGGGMSGVVFHKIAEGVMARNIKRDVTDARDSCSIFVPDVKNGDILAADFILKQLGIKTNSGWSGSYENGNPIWGTSSDMGNVVSFRKTYIPSNITPNVIGMGARDAVYILESKGLKVTIKGKGKVVSQSYQAGRVIMKGCTCHIELK
jgi:cell division protein FtsI (penicillin-binding protein 3)